jgi:hypothetical protein
MSDILSNYYKTFYPKTKKLHTMENFFTPNKNLNLKTDVTAQHLSPYGIYLSENNTLLISKKKGTLPAFLILGKKFNRDKIIPFSNKDLLKTSSNYYTKEAKIFNKIINDKDNNNFNQNSVSEIKKCCSHKKKINILLYNINNLRHKKKFKHNNKENIKALIMNNDNITKSINNSNNINQKSRNNLIECSSINTSRNNYSSRTKNKFQKNASINNFSRNKENEEASNGSIKKVKNKKFLFKDIHEMKNKNKAEKILHELLALKTNKEIKSYYIKKEHAEAITEANFENKNTANNSIDPLSTIKFNMANEPKNTNLFKSFNTQVMIMGNQKHRNDFLDGINIYKDKIVKYEDLRGPTGFDKNKIEEKKRNKIIQKMKMDYIGNKGFAFSNKLYKNKFNKKLSDFEFDNNYQSIKKLLFYNIKKYENNIKIKNNAKMKNKIDAIIDKKDIKILKKIDSDVEFIIHDKDEMLKFSRKFLSFDNKMNKMISNTRNATDYLFMRAKENQKIKKKIVNLYNDDEEN